MYFLTIYLIHRKEFFHASNDLEKKDSSTINNISIKLIKSRLWLAWRFGNKFLCHIYIFARKRKFSANKKTINNTN